MTFNETKDGAHVRTRFYTAKLLRRGGRIISLIRAGGAELVDYPGPIHVNCPGGIAKETECGYPGEMARDLFRQEILPADDETVRIRYTYHGKPGFFIGWSMAQVKTFIFRADSPLIEVEHSLCNVGAPEYFAEFRVHNEVFARDESVTIIPTTQGVREISSAAAAANYVADFTEGLAGIWHRQAGEALFFIPDYDAIAKFLFSRGTGTSTIEWYYRDFSIGDGAKWTARYRILPTSLATLGELPTVLAAAGVPLKLGRERRLQANIIIQKGMPKPLEPNMAETEFRRTVAANLAREIAFVSPDIVKDQALPGGILCSRTIHTHPGCGMEVTLPEGRDLVLTAEAWWKEEGPGGKEAYIGCCDPEGNLCAVSSAAKLSFWNPSATLDLSAGEWAGKSVRLFLYGQDIHWTSVRLAAKSGPGKKLFSSLCVRTPGLELVHGDACRLGHTTAQGLPKGAIRIYVAPKGDDSFTGRIPAPNARRSDGPFATLHRAQTAVRKLTKGGKPSAPVAVIIRAGTYELDKPLTFGPEDSGSADCPVLWTAASGETVMLSGGRRLTATWTPAGKGVYTCRLTGLGKKTPQIRQLFVGGKRVPRARVPRDGFFHVGAFADGSRRRVFYAPEDLRGVKGLNHAELLLYFVWNEGRRRIVRMDEKKGVLTLDASVHPALAQDRYVVENAPDGLATPGSWCYDPTQAELSWHPEAGVRPETVEVVVPVLRELVRFQGKKSNPVGHITLRGLTFAHSDWSELDSGQQSAVLVGSALSMEHAESCCLRGSRIVNVGTYGVGLYKGCRGNLVIGNEILRAGAGGVRIGGEEPDETTRENAVIGNDIHDCGAVYPSAIGVWIGQSSGNLVLRNHIHDLPYTGISVGWTWGPGANTHKANRIEGNTIERVMQLLHDGGAIYLLGVSYGTTVKDNVIRDIAGSGNGIYLDEGSTGMRVSGNIISRCPVGFSLHGARDNLLEDNVLAGISACFMGLSNCQSYMADNRFRRNIFYSNSDAPLIWAGGWTRRFVVESGENGFFHAGGKPFRIEGVAGIKTLDEWIAAGYETNPRMESPQFVDPANGDYRILKERSGG